MNRLPRIRASDCTVRSAIASGRHTKRHEKTRENQESDHETVRPVGLTACWTRQGVHADSVFQKSTIPNSSQNPKRIDVILSASYGNMNRIFRVEYPTPVVCNLDVTSCIGDGE
jgi:hypothetical protein